MSGHSYFIDIMEIQLLKNNKLISDFMGETDRNVFRHVHLEDLEYHVSWDWLMPVVEKIESLNHAVNITETYCFIDTYTQERLEDVGGGDYTKLSATYEAVVIFINWYNQQN